jgi:hypothetical protein
MTEENKIIARRVYEIISTGDLDRAGEIVDPEAPDNELLSDDLPARFIETFKDTFTEAREAFPDYRQARRDRPDEIPSLGICRPEDSGERALSGTH